MFDASKSEPPWTIQARAIASGYLVGEAPSQQLNATWTRCAAAVIVAAVAQFLREWPVDYATSGA